VSDESRELNWEEGSPLYPNAKAAGERVDFRSVDPRKYLDVSSEYLRIHGALAQVLHMTGAGEAIDRILWDWNQYVVLAEDGTDAELLSARLSLIEA